MVRTPLWGVRAADSQGDLENKNHVFYSFFFSIAYCRENNVVACSMY